MYSRILVPLDGSTLAAQALPYATLLAKRFNADLLLFRAVPTLVDIVRAWNMRYEEDEVDDVIAGPTWDEWNALHGRMKRDALDELERDAEALRQQGLRAEAKVGEGDPAEAIAEEAEGSPGTLIVMTTHGYSGLKRMWLGSVTDKLVQATLAPMLVVRCHEDGSAPVEPSIGRVILPLDGSNLSEHAIPHAAAVAKALSAPVEVLLALRLPHYDPVRYPAPMVSSGAGLDSRMADYGERIADRLRDAGIPSTEVVVAQSDAAEAITDAAEATPGSLIVMSTHGRTGFKRWALGSVADRVVRHSGRPVLLIRAQRQEARQEAPAPTAA